MPKILWNAKSFLKKVNAVAEEVAKDGAELVLKDAKRILRRNAKAPTGKLASEIDIFKSNFTDGGYIVMAQAPGHYIDRYYAVHVELGTSDTKAIPFLRPALNQNKRKITKMYQEAMK